MDGILRRHAAGGAAAAAAPVRSKSGIERPDQWPAWKRHQQSIKTYLAQLTLFLAKLSEAAMMLAVLQQVHRLTLTLTLTLPSTLPSTPTPTPSPTPTPTPTLTLNLNPNPTRCTGWRRSTWRCPSSCRGCSRSCCARGAWAAARRPACSRSRASASSLRRCRRLSLTRASRGPTSPSRKRARRPLPTPLMPLAPLAPLAPLHQAEVTTFALGTDLEEDYAVSGLETPRTDPRPTPSAPSAPSAPPHALHPLYPPHALHRPR